MHIWKRAYLHTVRKKGKTILMFSILLVMSSLILTCLSIQSATNAAALNIRKSLMGGFSINAGRVENLLDEKSVSNILDVAGVRKNYNLRSYYFAEYQNIEGKNLKIKEENSNLTQQGFESVGKMISSTHSDLDTYFKESILKLEKGRHITKGDDYAMLISDDFAKRNNLHLNDKIRIKDVQSDRFVEKKIVGIFSIKEKQKVSDTTPTDQIFENICFTDDSTFSKLTFQKGNHYQYGDFYVDDPAQLDDVIKKVKSISGMDWKNSLLTKDDADYQNSKAQVETLQKLVQLIIIVLIIISFVLLALILLLWIRNRIHEIGMMLSMGLSKGNIIAQHFIELFMIALFAFTLSYVTSTFISQKIADSLLDQTTEHEKVQLKDLTNNEATEETKKYPLKIETIKVEISIRDFLVVNGIGYTIILVSVIVASYPMMRLKPKEILSKMS